ncbi:uncharacterized protein B0T23DRAFT_316085 [Neurospora hispaniola]|uniref:Uncharacterized protein n=1 Tax=Neurospora hispaniola TaxID=588809 RepID=A0AAJ0I8P1_9PEZI|nr:hypothetical protein B0T23DRAFT_316085 [Neurospora hispaniola]
MVRRGVGPWWSVPHPSDNMARKSLTGLSWSDTAAAANNNGRTHSRKRRECVLTKETIDFAT